MPNLRSQSFGVAEKASWLGSGHGIWDGRTVRLLVSAFTEDHKPDGDYLPSGLPLALNEDGIHVPYDGTGQFEGFLLTDQSVQDVDGTINVPLLDHGRVKVNNLPVEFAPPAPADDATTIVYQDAAPTTGGEG